jgi:hypothetical protein
VARVSWVVVPVCVQANLNNTAHLLEVVTSRDTLYFAQSGTELAAGSILVRFVGVSTEAKRLLAPVHHFQSQRMHTVGHQIPTQNTNNDENIERCTG